MNAKEIFNCPIVSTYELVKDIREISYNSIYYRNLKGKPFTEIETYKIEEKFRTIFILSKTVDLKTLKYIKPYIKLNRVCKEAGINYLKLWRRIENNKDITTADAKVIQDVLQKHFGE